MYKGCFKKMFNANKSNGHKSYSNRTIWKEYEWWNHATLKNLDKKYIIPIKGIGGYFTHFWHDEKDSKVYIGRIIL